MRSKLWIIAVLLPLLAACSALRFTYNQGVDLAFWWMNGYLDFSNVQRPRVRAALGDYFAWHRHTQLPTYAAQLGQLRALVAQPTTPEAVCQWAQVGRDHALVAFEHGVPALAELVRDLSGGQIHHLELRFKKSDDDFRDDYLQSNLSRRQAASVKRVVDRAELLYGNLEPEQLALIKAQVAQSPFDPELWLAERQARQREIVQVLQVLYDEGADAARTQAALRALAQQVLQSPRPAYRAYSARLADYNCQFAAQVHNTTTPLQRRHAAQRLKGWEDDLRTLIVTPPS